MRYTLRLLTAQQFLRAASLVCVLEDIRSSHEDELGESPFGIGVWLGGIVNTEQLVKRAVEATRAAAPQPADPEPLPSATCPWCGTQMGPSRKGKGGQDVIGYEQVGRDRVMLRCVDVSVPLQRPEGLAGPRHRRGHLRVAAVDRDRHRRQVRHDGLAAAGPTTVRSGGRRRARGFASGPDHSGRAAPHLRPARIDGRSVRAGHRRPVHRPPRSTRRSRRRSSPRPPPSDGTRTRSGACSAARTWRCSRPTDSRRGDRSSPSQRRLTDGHPNPDVAIWAS